jgi:pimeloyl-ACP methyl ester carboxylesterase
VAAVAVLDGTVPSVGPEATPGGIVDLARRCSPMLSQLRRPLALLSTGLVAPLIPFAHYAYQAYRRAWPEDDKRLLADPEIEAIFVDDIINLVRGHCQAVVDDARLLGRDWGFRLADVKVPVRWWHGDADPLVPVAGVEASVSRLQDAELTLRSGESHLGGFAKIDDVLEFIRSYL